MSKSAAGGVSSSRDPQARSSGRDTNLSIIAVGTRVVGELATDGVVKVEGTIEGSIRAEHQVLVAKGGVIEGDVYTREAIVGGRVVGSVFADERVEVQASSMVQGDIVTKCLVVQEGGEVNGHVRMQDPKALEHSAAVARPQTTEASAGEAQGPPASYPRAASSG